METTLEYQENLQGACRIDGRQLYDVVGVLYELSTQNLRRSDYFHRSLDAICDYLRASVGVLNLRIGARTLERVYETDDAQAAPWIEAIDSLVIQVQTDESAMLKCYRDQDGEPVAFAIAAPVLSAGGKAMGAVAAIVAGPSGGDGRAELAQLTQLLELVVENAPHANGQGKREEESKSKSLQSVVRASDYRSIDHLCFAIVNSLCSKLACEQISIGLVRGQQIRLIAVSGLSEVPRNTPGMEAVKQAMATCLDRNETTVVQPEGRLVDQCESSRCKVHQFWHRIAADACVATIPLRIDGRCVAVISLRRQSDKPLAQKDIARARILAESFAPALPLVDRASRSVVRHVVDAISTTANYCYSWQGLGRKAVAALLVLGLGWAMFGEIQYDVMAPGKIVSAHVNTVAAPFDGMIGEVLVEPGQRVRSGQLLVRFDPTEFQTERNRILTEMTSKRIEANALLQRREPQEAFLLQSQIVVHEAELKLIEQKLHRANVRAQVDGVILPTDIHRRVGQFVNLGEPLLEVADENQWHIEVETPEEEIRHLELSQAGQFQTRARPDQYVNCHVQKINPASHVIRQKNVVLVNAVMDADARQNWMKIGMEGHVRISTGKQPVWWVYLHPIVDFARLRLWL